MDLHSTLKEHGLQPPPQGMSQDLYQWLEDARVKLGVRFISDTRLPLAELRALTRELGEPVPDLDYYYARSTPWDYGIEEYWRQIERVKKECQSNLVKFTDLSDSEARDVIERLIQAAELSSLQEYSVQQLRAELDTKPSPASSRDELNEFASGKANLAVALTRLGATDAVWPRLTASRWQISRR